jgi:hypothetical protein|tara:strand:- start:26 stop:193 length:168 start_codon:yes stop_codon:yes gene_type:complete
MLAVVVVEDQMHILVLAQEVQVELVVEVMVILKMVQMVQQEQLTLEVVAVVAEKT